MVKFFETPEFRALQSAWYRTLERRGFKDAESLVGTEPMLKHDAKFPYRWARDLRVREAKLAYYTSLSKAVAEYKFEDEIEQQIMEMHSNGAGVVEIYQAIKAAGSPYGRETVRFIIRRFETLWKIRNWTPEQMRKKQYSPKKK